MCIYTWYVSLQCTCASEAENSITLTIYTSENVFIALHDHSYQDRHQLDHVMAFVRVFLCCLMLVKVVFFVISGCLSCSSAVSHHKSVGPSPPVSQLYLSCISPQERWSIPSSVYRSSVPATSTVLPHSLLLMAPMIKTDPPYHLSVETLHVSVIA